MMMQKSIFNACNVCNIIQMRGVASAPLVQQFRPSWPAKTSSFEQSAKVVAEIPKRTVPESALRFKLKSTFAHGSAIYYPHLKFNPTDFKVTLSVELKELGLTAEEEQVFILMVGPRYNVGNRTVKLTAERFPNRIENKKYLTMLLENLIAESKKLNVVVNDSIGQQ